MTKKRLHKGFKLGAYTGADSTVIDAANLYVTDNPDEEGVHYEFSIVLMQFREGRYAIQARVFSDAWLAFTECEEVFTILSEMHQCCYRQIGTPEPFDELVKKLEKAGWKNEGRRIGRFWRSCSECGTEVKAPQ